MEKIVMMVLRRRIDIMKELLEDVTKQDIRTFVELADVGGPFVEALVAEIDSLEDLLIAAITAKKESILG